MNVCLRALLCCAGVSALSLGPAAAQTTPPIAVAPGVTLPANFKVLNPGGKMLVVRPPSGLVESPGHARTNILLAVPQGGYRLNMAPLVGAPPQAGYLFQTPASIACVYGVVAASKGCDPNQVTAVPTGGSKAIAIVDAYDLTTAAADLAKFNTQFGLPAANFTVIFGTGSPSAGCKSGARPPSATSTGWDIEEDLDIQYAHAMAPKAKLYLVEAASDSDADLLNAEQVAALCVAVAGGGEVSNSWGGSEFSGQTAYDKYFVRNGVVFFASSGDKPEPLWPAASPNVVAVGGTTLSYDPNTGAYLGQQAWYPLPDYFGYNNELIGSGAGTSQFEARPVYQSAVSKVVGAHRGIVDVVAVADPYTGVWIYNSTSIGGFGAIGGTSVAAPLVAGITNASNNFFGATAGYLAKLYTLGANNQLGGLFAKMDSGNCGVPTTPSDSAPSRAKYITFGGTIDSQQQEAALGFNWNECGGWGWPISTKAIFPTTLTAEQ